MERKLSATSLHRIVTAIFVAAGAPEDHAHVVADVLVDNQLAGHDSHGVVRIPQYLDAIDAGEIDPTARPVVLEETPTTALVDGRWAFGQVAASFAVDVLVDKALAAKVASVAIVRANHTGRLAAFTERASRRGVVTFMAIGTVGKPRTAPHGGAGPALGTNPVSVSVPNDDGPPVTLDYATSAIANGKIMVARAEGRQLPPGVVVTRSGAPTTDPADYFRGGFLLPFGGHKGYALAVIAEVLGGIVTGADEHDQAAPAKSGVFLFGLARDAFRSSAGYQAALSATIERITSVPPAAGVEEVLVPGMPEARARADRERNGLTFGAGTWRSVVEEARKRGVDVDALAGESSPGG